MKKKEEVGRKFQYAQEKCQSNFGSNKNGVTLGSAEKPEGKNRKEGSHGKDETKDVTKIGFRKGEKKKKGTKTSECCRGN